jgi:hypothetical protein
MNAIVRTEPAEQSVPSSVSALMAIIDRAASDPNFDPARLMQLLEVKERWDATEARKAFTVAMAAFKAAPPKIVKNKHVRFQTSKGVTNAQRGYRKDRSRSGSARSFPSLERRAIGRSNPRDLSHHPFPGSF